MAAKNYKVEVKEAKGSCNSDLFKKMAQNGDLSATQVKSAIGKVVTITGYATCHISTDDKEFDMTYYATEEGILSSGSAIFKSSVEEYIDSAKRFLIKEIKTGKGTTFKVTPILTEE